MAKRATEPEYFMLDPQDLEDDTELVEIEDYPQIDGILSWHLGQPFKVPVPNPIEIPLSGGPDLPRPEYFKGSIPLMTKTLVGALGKAGVDNIETYPAVLRNPDGSVASRDYAGVNIIGLVAAADLGKSLVAKGTRLQMVSTSFDSLVIDGKRARSLLLFRLAEAITGVVVHRKVRDALRTDGFATLGFIDPGEWMS
jgi:hypothetical protein